MMSQSCVQVVFCRKDGLTETEVQSLRHYARENNIAFRGKNAYFCLRNSEPYHCSWFLETKEQQTYWNWASFSTDLHKQLGQGKTPAELASVPASTCRCMTVRHGAPWCRRKEQYLL
ncbi:MAG: hypothetical protein ACLSFT_08460 [Ruminococcus callidus]